MFASNGICVVLHSSVSLCHTYKVTSLTTPHLADYQDAEPSCVQVCLVQQVAGWTLKL